MPAAALRAIPPLNRLLCMLEEGTRPNLRQLCLTHRDALPLGLAHVLSLIH